MEKVIISERKFEKKYPEEQAKIESKEYPIKTEESEKSINDSEINEKDLKKSFIISLQDPNYPQYIPPNLKFVEPKSTISKPIDYKIINEEKRRRTSGKMVIVSPQEYAKMHKLERLKLAGEGDDFILFPGQFSKGNVELTGPATGKKREPVMSQIFNSVSS